MTYLFFQDILAALGKRLNFESLSNIYGRTTFDKKSAKETQKLIIESNPLYTRPKGGSAQAFLGMATKIPIIDARKGNSDAQMKKHLGETSWFEEFIK